MGKKRKQLLSVCRRLSQAVCLLVFLFLFVKTDFTGADTLEYAVNILFRIDPLLATCTLLAAKTFINLMLPALFIVGLSIIAGRAFCGWLCPMGSLIDFLHPILPPANKHPDTIFPRLRYSLLIIVLAGSLFGLPLVGLVDPFSILVRGLVLAVYPAFNFATETFFTYTYQQAPPWVNLITEPVYGFLKAGILPFSQKYYLLAFFSASILLSVFLLELWQRRFFCRSVCPLGAMLGLIAKVGFLHGHGGSIDCKKCRTCRSVCRMGAIDETRRIKMEACSLCMECLDSCPRSIISFKYKKTPGRPAPFIFSRRLFFGSLAGGAVAAFTGVRGLAKTPDPLLVRPPGSLMEKEFLGRCVRCGECMKVCIGNALQPVFLEAGFEGMFTPKLSARIGYCEYNCTLCGQVCPTGAISNLTLSEKQKVKIGHVYFDKNRCLPHAKGIPCIVCEEHCPTHDKAIKFREAVVEDDKGQKVNVLQPYVVDDLCIGCGICENKCPLPGNAAVLLTSAGESRNPEKALPKSFNAYG